MDFKNSKYVCNNEWLFRNEAKIGLRSIKAELELHDLQYPDKEMEGLRKELESIEKEMPELQKEKEMLEQKMSTNLSYEDLQKAADRISKIIQLLDEKELRWLEFSERLG